MFYDIREVGVSQTMTSVIQWLTSFLGRGKDMPTVADMREGVSKITDKTLTYFMVGPAI